MPRASLTVRYRVIAARYAGARDADRGGAE
ncbi:hypothetical protein DFJ66_2908 [Saccharothrix variisporea]|uniref:Uncharacterized protein n=1 Tax=Saccharothrix variisporea TaxID=543527 RepID=A0A495X6F9_9PSEU|nr:hypothetical protein DFJ66_2908 [Saccharothrix variisporea]